MATISVGNIKFNWKGAWSNSTTYAIDDVVSLSGSSYISIQAGSNQNPASASAYWQQMSSAGTNGTDVGATLANKEIAFKTNAGAVDGIPIGNAGEFLKVNSGATGYEYGAVSSDYVKIASGAVAGNATAISIDGYYSSTYKNYKLFFQNIQNDNSTVKMRVNFGGSSNSGGSYRMVMVGLQNNGGNLSTAQISNWDNDHLNMTNWGASNGYGDIINLDIFDPQSTTYTKKFQWVASSYNSSEIHILTANGYFNNNTSTASTGLTFLSSNNMTTGNWYLYGIKG